MATLTIGSEFTTNNSKVTGIIKEIHSEGRQRPVLLLDVNGEDRYTTV
jgi:hypothetical protein